jgi:hypothetical protein
VAFSLHFLASGLSLNVEYFSAPKHNRGGHGACGQRDGLADVLADELEASAARIAKRLRSALPDIPPKAYRWVAEMEEAGGFAGPTPAGEMFRAVAAFYGEVAAQTEGYE